MSLELARLSEQRLLVWRGRRRGGEGLVVVVVVVVAAVVQRDDGVFLTERPPPAEPGQAREGEVRVPLAAQLLDEAEYVDERLLRAPVVRRDRDVAAEVEHGRLLEVGEAGLLQHHHAVRLAQDVVVERALRYAVVRGRLCKAHFLRHYRLYRLFQLGLRPRRRFHFQ